MSRHSVYILLLLIIRNGFSFSAGKSSTSEEVEDMLEKENIAIFTSGVSTKYFITSRPYFPSVCDGD